MSALHSFRYSRIPLIALFAATGCSFSGVPSMNLGGDASGIFNQRGTGLLQLSTISKDWSQQLLRPSRISPRPVPQRPPVEPARPDPSCRSGDRGTLSIETAGSFGALPTGSVELRTADGVVARGAVYSELQVPTGCPVEARVTFLSLADDPIRTVEGLLVSQGSESARRTVAIETGLLRVRASSNGRQISGPARLHRVDRATNRVDAAASGTISANNVSREVSAGTYEIRLPYRGRTLAARVTVAAGSTRMVTLSE